MATSDLLPVVRLESSSGGVKTVNAGSAREAELRAAGWRESGGKPSSKGTPEPAAKPEPAEESAGTEPAAKAPADPRPSRKKSRRS